MNQNKIIHGHEVACHDHTTCSYLAGHSTYAPTISHVLGHSVDLKDSSVFDVTDSESINTYMYVNNDLYHWINCMNKRMQYNN